MATSSDSDISSKADSLHSSEYSERSLLLKPEPASESDDWLDTTLRDSKPWISYCLANHEKCRLMTPIAIPTRLIDVGPQDGSKDPFIFISSSRCSAQLEQKEDWPPKIDVESFRYIALSYCWGKSGNLTTTIHNLDTMQTGIKWDTIPQTIKDAILVTRKLGVRYLWVDALCIIQGPGGDWEVESPKMADVYGGAFLTISAALSPDVGHGLRQSIESPLPIDNWTKRARKGLSHSGPRVANVSEEYRLTSHPLYKRGWALQERILSRRLLIFCRDGVYWECQSSAQSKFFPQLASRGGGRLRETCSDREWGEILEDYTSRLLTLESDKLPALSGVAMVYHRSTKQDYLAGLWKQSLLTDLLWRRQQNPFLPTIKPAKPSTFRAPSWSWSSIDANIQHFGVTVTRFATAVIDAHVELKNPLAPFGEVIGGSITLCGPMLPGKTIKADDNFNVGLDFDATPPLEEIWYMLLVIDSYDYGHGIALVSGKGPSKNEYERVGFFIFGVKLRDADGEPELRTA